MPRVDFSLFSYFPSLLCGESERLAYTNLSEPDKGNLVPIFELSRRNRAPDLSAANQMVRSTVSERPFILDIDKRPAPDPYIAKNPSDPVADAIRVKDETAARDSYNAELQSLLNPDNGFARWRAHTATFPNAIPCLQFTDVVSERRQILRQAALLASADASIAIRIGLASWEDACDIAIEILSVLPRADQLLLIFDAGQGRSRINEKINAVRAGIRRIQSRIDLSQRPGLRAVCMSNSFPNPNHDGLKTLASHDWTIWKGARDSFEFAFGDYAATSRLAALSSYVPREWRPTVTYAKEEEWVINRDINVEDPEGWIRGAQAIVKHGGVTELGDCWGNKLIENANDEDIDGVQAPRFWHAAKINSHIHRQISFAAEMADDYTPDEED